MCKMNLANKLTTLRILLIPIFLAVLYAEMDYAGYIACGIFLIASLTDALDGYIARKYNLVSNFGKFADPLADKLLVMAAFIALVEFGRIAGWIVIIILSREFIVTGFRLLAAEKNIVLAADFWGKLKTIAHMTLIVFLMLDLSFQGADVAKYTLISICIILSVYSAYEMININRQVFITPK